MTPGFLREEESRQRVNGAVYGESVPVLEKSRLFFIRTSIN